MKIEDVKQWNCGNGLAVAENPYHKLHQIEWGVGNWETLPKWTEFEDWRLKPANQPVTDLSGIYNSEQVKIVHEYLAFKDSLSDNDEYIIYDGVEELLNETSCRLVLAESAKKSIADTLGRSEDMPEIANHIYSKVPDESDIDWAKDKIAALCNTDRSPEVVISKIESPAQITIGDTSFTKLTDGFIQILTKNGCVELVPEEIEELYKFIK